MTDVLLTHSYHLAHDAKQMRKMQPYAPLGTLYAATALRSADISVSVFDTTLQDPVALLPEILLSQRPAIVVIYEDDFNFLSKMCLLSMRETSKYIAGTARQIGAIVVAHGSDATDNAAEYLASGVDYVLTGEAEQTLTELCRKLLSRQSVENVPGLVWADARRGVVRSTGGAVKNSTWSAMPRIARELIDAGPYRSAWKSAHGYFSANVVAGRGCPYHCNWCAKPISGNKYQLRPAQAVVDEVHELKELYGVQHIWFGDDIFALNRQWTLEFANTMEAQGCVLPFKVQTRADLMSAEIVDAMRRAGCAEVWMGVESGSQKVLDAMDKGLRVVDVRAATTRLHDSGIRACFFLQFGYPGETWRDIQQTIALVRATRPDDIGVSLSYPLPGTVFYERVRAEIGAKRNWRDSDDLCVMFSGAYTNDFYRTLRDALHAEVDSWRSSATADRTSVEEQWERVHALEPISRIRAAENAAVGSSGFVPLQQLHPVGGVV